MKIVIGTWFTLPRLGRDVFAALMKEGVVYDKEMGFKLEISSDVEAAVKTLRAATEEEVELVLRCFVCGRESCLDCPYSRSCDRTSVSSFCLCGTHSVGEGAYEQYGKAFMELFS